MKNHFLPSPLNTQLLCHFIIGGILVFMEDRKNLLLNLSQLYSCIYSLFYCFGSRIWHNQFHLIQLYLFLQFRFAPVSFFPCRMVLGCRCCMFLFFNNTNWSHCTTRMYDCPCADNIIRFVYVEIKIISTFSIILNSLTCPIASRYLIGNIETKTNSR